ncbi:TPA: DUF1471 domain-containing protein [Klebsiella pneumoniae]|jgi:hypothetical protein|uniref:DUF1471 domain-containing protein n=1 Tax=Klebsiella TaxID=570 RepID=UPI000E496101|nr:MULTISPECIES: DUF1471 domain-containing protein [Klebsiella]HBQ6198016.1 DUF1471 domain-containing protein [Klebsiella variicola subsp. variicola]MBA6167588.1 DUF1471 domain-containing protein [Klebsiella variicola]MBA6183292.1 DUF1471 domain-containing protein [Klebsiella variicola]MCJ3091638.1 DUF1471 domain-containing protein [Klebsiella quasipneumoniae]MCJ6763174.1 DUF1471 domain-containing protein [Klebsiella variicola]
MKNALITLLLSSLIMSFSVNAETVTGYGYSIDSAENMIKEKAKEKGFTNYQITSARMGNYTTMSAKLIK